MAKRKPGGQPGNRNAAGPRARSDARAQVKAAVRTRALTAGARGVTISGNVRAVEVRAFVTARPSRENYTGVRVSTGTRRR